jgi:hypothetical protein
MQNSPPLIDFDATQSKHAFHTKRHVDELGDNYSRIATANEISLPTCITETLPLLFTLSTNEGMPCLVEHPELCLNT